MKVRRRDFMKTMGILGAGVLVYSPTLNVFAESSEDAKALDAVTGEWVASTCQGCTTWCPAQIYVQNDGSIKRVVKVRGNEYSKVSPGKVCPRGHMIPALVYDPDRLKVPMKRTNTSKGKGVDPQFVAIDWAEALATVAAKIKELRDADETHKYMLLRGRYTYNRDLIYSAMTKIIGSPNGVSHSSICAEAENAASDYTEGTWGYRDYDLSNSKFVVFWAVDPFRSNRGVPMIMNMRQAMIDNGCTTVTIDPTLTIGASKSDKWFPIKPGTDGALASAIAHHILVNGSWHKAFVGDFNGTGASAFVANTDAVESDFTEVETKGLIKWWNLELKDKTPAWAAAITGISQTDIEWLAAGLAAQKPNVCIWYGPGITMSPRGVYAGMGANALNGLLGSIDNIGGSHKRKSVSSKANAYVSTTSYHDTVAVNGLAKGKIHGSGTELFPAIEGTPGKVAPTNNTPNGMLAANPYEIKVCLAYRNNFVFSCPDPSRWHDAFGDNNPNGAPFLAHLTTMASEMSIFADILLPCKFDGVENWAFLKTAGNLYGEITIQQPMIDTIFDCYGTENEIPFLIAKELNDNHGFSNLYDYYTTEYKDPDTLVAPANEEEFAEYALKYMVKPAYTDASVGDWATMKQKGVYTAGPTAYEARWGSGSFGTVSGKFEFFSEKLQTALGTHATKYSKTIDEILTACGYEAQGERAFVPHYESPKRHGSLVDYPFDFVDSKSRFNREGRSANIPGYYQFKKLDPGDVNWGDCAKINPVDATTLGIVTGDAIKITNSNGKFLTTKAMVWEGVRPGTVAKTYGQGHWAYGRLASDFENLTETTGSGNNCDVLIEDYERISGSTARNGGFTGVKIEKIII